MANKTIKRRRICKFCATKVKHIDYKNIRILRRYVSMHGKIQPKYYSGVCAKHQRGLSNAIKTARIAALLPFVR